MAKPARKRQYRGRFKVQGGGASITNIPVWVCDTCGTQHKHKKPAFFCVNSACHGTTFTFFHSVSEANRLAQLRLEERAGLIRDIRMQVPFPLLVPGPSGLPIKIGELVVDFTYTDVKTGDEIVEDVKGERVTDLAVWKIKHCEAQYGVKVKLFKKD